MSKKLPFIKFYFDDFFGDEEVELMDNQAIGAYLRLLKFCWQNPEKGVRYDPKRLMLLTRSGKGWKRIEEQVVNRFYRVEIDGVVYLRHKRLDEEMDKANKKSELYRTNIKKRWGTTVIPLNNNSNSIGIQQNEVLYDRYQNQNQNQNQTHPLTPSRGESVCDEKSKSLEIEKPEDESWHREFVNICRSYPRHRIGNPYAAEAKWDEIRLSWQNRVSEIISGLQRWLRSSDWKIENGRYIPKLETWLDEQLWQVEPRNSAERAI